MTWEALRELAGFHSDRGCALSLYLDLDPSTAPTPADVDTRLRSLLAHAEKELANGNGGSQQRRVAVAGDLARIRDWWDNEFDRDGARGIALFVSGADDLWRVLRLPESVPDDVHFGGELRVTPLVDLIGGHEGALVAAVNRERGHVYRVTGGRLEEVVDLSEEQPGRHDQGGWSQARFRRHIEKLVAEHLKAIGSEIDKRVRRARIAQLVIVAPEELRGEIEGALSAEAREAIVGWAIAEAHASPAELFEVARPHLDHARVARSQESLERWQEERGRDARASAGWNETLPAASDGRVELLLVAAGPKHEAFRCPQCGRAEASAGSCPLDETQLEPGDGAELAVHQTLAHGGSIVKVLGPELDDAEGVGALLRF